MPRPEAPAVPEAAPGLDFEDLFSRVESPRWRYSGSVVRVSGRTVTVSGDGYEDEFTLDAPPDIDRDRYYLGSGAVVGYLDGQPFVIVRDTGCRCNGSRKAPK